MAKKKNTLGALLSSTSKLFQETKGDVPYIPSILEFCYSPAYLDLQAKGIKLYPVQELVLRAFYRGSIGNAEPKHMTMTEEERLLCLEKGLNDNHNGNIIDKWESGVLFKEMVLVWGRRSGKDFTISIIALYEAMRLLECPGGDPYRIYELGNAAPFNILTIANNKEQAGILFREIQGKLLSSPYFHDKYVPDGITAGKIHLLTPQNKIDRDAAIAKGLSPQPGSVVIETGHSNSNGLVGKGCFVLMLDEAGLYKRTGGPGSDEQIYGNLSPTILTYVRNEYIRDKDGKLIDVKKHYDGKIISISSPRGMDGVFYNKYKKAPNVAQMLMCRLPTWDVNSRHTEAGIRAEEQSMTDQKFRMEFGAEFSGTEGENFFPPEYVEKCFHTHQFNKHDVYPNHWGKPGITYFAHLDPAISSHNYALAVVHKHHFINRETKKIDFWIVLDHLKVWTPTEGKPISIDEVDEYVIDLRRRFHMALVTYDQWNSQSSIEKMRKNGIPAMCTRFNKGYKIQIYDELYKLVAQEKLKLPYVKLMYDEMMNLQRKFMAQGYRIYPKTEGECRTDDTCDALAAACFNALRTESQRLPQAQLVNMGTSPTANSVVWRSMQGVPYGVGTGQQVARWMSNRTPPWHR
jgi:hypothetical protein